MQLTLPETTSRTLRDEGLALIEQHAGAFLTVMRGLAQRISAERGCVSADDLRPIAESLGLFPHHPNCWGSLFKASGWEMVGHKVSEFPSNHAREVKTWRWIADPHIRRTTR